MMSSALALAVNEAQFGLDIPVDLMTKFHALNAAITVNPKSARAFIDMGTFLLQPPSHELWEASVAYFEKAHQIDQTNTHALTGLGIAHWKLNDIAAGVKNLKQAQFHKPDTLIPAFLLGAKFLKDGDLNAVKAHTGFALQSRADEACAALYYKANGNNKNTDIADFRRLFGRSKLSAFIAWTDMALTERHGKSLREPYEHKNAFGLTFAFGTLSSSHLIRFQPRKDRSIARFIIGG